MQALQRASRRAPGSLGRTGGLDGSWCFCLLVFGSSTLGSRLGRSKMLGDKGRSAQLRSSINWPSYLEIPPDRRDWAPECRLGAKIDRSFRSSFDDTSCPQRIHKFCNVNLFVLLNREPMISDCPSGLSDDGLINYLLRWQVGHSRSVSVLHSLLVNLLWLLTFHLVLNILILFASFTSLDSYFIAFLILIL